jgi:hypothetical protein
VSVATVARWFMPSLGRRRRRRRRRRPFT